MKKILMALAIAAFAYSGAEAQDKCKTPVRHKTVKAKPKAVKQNSVVVLAPTPQPAVAQASVCRLVPYQVCTILSDRKTVKCYNTMDIEDLNPVNRETTYYGPDGPMPGQPEKFDVETVVIKGKGKGEYCKRTNDGNGTLCYQSGRLTRDEFGYYSYR